MRTSTARARSLLAALPFPPPWHLTLCAPPDAVTTGFVAIAATRRAREGTQLVGSMKIRAQVFRRNRPATSMRGCNGLRDSLDSLTANASDRAQSGARSRQQSEDSSNSRHNAIGSVAGVLSRIALTCLQACLTSLRVMQQSPGRASDVVDKPLAYAKQVLERHAHHVLVLAPHSSTCAAMYRVCRGLGRWTAMV